MAVQIVSALVYQAVSWSCVSCVTFSRLVRHMFKSIARREVCILHLKAIRQATGLGLACRDVAEGPRANLEARASAESRCFLHVARELAGTPASGATLKARPAMDK